MRRLGLTIAFRLTPSALQSAPIVSPAASKDPQDLVSRNQVRTRTSLLKLIREKFHPMNGYDFMAYSFFVAVGAHRNASNPRSCPKQLVFQIIDRFEAVVFIKSVLARSLPQGRIDTRLPPHPVDARYRSSSSHAVELAS